MFSRLKDRTEIVIVLKDIFSIMTQFSNFTLLNVFPRWRSMVAINLKQYKLFTGLTID
jgi:hypothetical protein